MNIKNQIEQLATQCGVTAKDMEGFLLCIKNRMNRGMSFESAVKAHMNYIHWQMNNIDPDSKKLAIDMYEELKAAYQP